MRIIAGQCKGLRLTPVGKGDAGAHLRPTTDRIRESLFNVLNARIDFDDLVVMDVFAGTGALGLEALSRGAASCTFVDNGRVAQGLIRDNIALTHMGDRSTLMRCDVQKLGASPDTPHDLVFMDPPYGKGLGEMALDALVRGGWLAPDAMVVWEDSSAPDVPQNFDILDQRPYGGTVITLLERQS